MSYRVSEEILQIARQGEKVRAIALLREQSGLGLAQAKNLLEDTLEHSQANTSKLSHPPLTTPQEVMQQIEAALARGEKLQAIKLLCESTGVSLLEAKERIEKQMCAGQPQTRATSSPSPKDKLGAPGEVRSSSVWPTIALLLATLVVLGSWYYFKKG